MCARKDVVNTYYTRKSIRLKNYDYSNNGMYFVTICTYNREKILSKIEENNVGADDPVRPEIKKCSSTIKNIYQFQNVKMELKPIGKIVNEIWYKIPKIYPNIKLHSFIIMPDHIHGIIEIGDDKNNDDKMGGMINNKMGGMINNKMGGQSRPPLHKIIQGFKSVTTRKCFKLGYRIIWQRNYYEHIIRNENEYLKICRYIKNNPIRYIQ